ncbi:hypothetical protein, partial [Brevibacterium casei]|uniref:hypothetical protein n=1 Tax=Brevibacterium casei TaxID=33889 RepID=UPI001C92F784
MTRQYREFLDSVVVGKAERSSRRSAVVVNAEKGDLNRPGDNRGREIGRRRFSLASEIHRR